MGKRFRNFPGGNSRGICRRKCKGMSENFWRDFLAKIVKIVQRKMSYGLFGELSGRSYAEVLGKMYGGEFSGGICLWKICKRMWGNFLGEISKANVRGFSEKALSGRNVT